MKLISVALCALALSGCAAQKPLYQWGGYDAVLYQSYKNPEKAVELRQKLEKHVMAMEQSRQKIAPGLYAELGTMYFQTGDAIRARGYYSKERDTWPESKGLMDSLIANLDRQNAPKAEVKS